MRQLQRQGRLGQGGVLMIMTNSLQRAQRIARKHHKDHEEEVLIYQDQDWGFIVVTATEANADPELEECTLVDVFDHI